MTLGEYRVGISFNPSQSGDVEHIKRAVADLIDFLDRFAERNEVEVPEVRRLAMVAAEQLEAAAMTAVKAVTKGPYYA